MQILLPLRMSNTYAVAPSSSKTAAGTSIRHKRVKRRRKFTISISSVKSFHWISSTFKKSLLQNSKKKTEKKFLKCHINMSRSSLVSAQNNTTILLLVFYLCAVDIVGLCGGGHGHGHGHGRDEPVDVHFNKSRL